jgi:hypothetical protein
MTDFDADPPIAYIVDPVYTVELRDDFWLGFTIFGDTLRVTCTTNEKQATSIVNLELAKGDIYRGRPLLLLVLEGSIGYWLE